MRISDWSSDVCSSDLAEIQPARDSLCGLSPVEAPMRPILPLLLLAALPAFAADPVPEITRPAATPQAPGVVHTLRQIPEACARIEGAFTGQAVEPYQSAVARPPPTSPKRNSVVS